MDVYLIRHGMTEGNRLRRYIGRTDEPLSPEGVRQAQSVNHGIECERVYVSPMLRTAQTASILFPDAEQIVMEDFREMDFGDFENRSAEDMEQDPAYRTWVEGGCITCCPNGEGHAAYAERVCAAFSVLIGSLRTEGADKAVLVVHGGTIMAILEGFALPRRDCFDYRLEACDVYSCRVTEGEPIRLLKTE